jgi:hypothetical protein
MLMLKRASASRPSGEWSDDDYDVLADGIVVGRIMKAAAVLRALWFPPDLPPTCRRYHQPRRVELRRHPRAHADWAAAETEAIAVSPHNYNSTTMSLSATVHAAACMPNFIITEYFLPFEEISERLCPDALKPVNGQSRP